MSFNNSTNLYRKIERLSSAVFLVSDTMRDTEELKTKVRHLAIELLSHSTLLKDGIIGGGAHLITKIDLILTETASLFGIASVSGMISEMNASILKQEFDLLVQDLNELRNSFKYKDDAVNDFFKLNFGSPILNKPLLEVLAKNEIPEKDKNNRKEHREKAIIDVIKLKGKISIKDISKSIRGCSEKTIQRKLISLIESGIVKKDGERRWSMYSLA